MVSFKIWETTMISYGMSFYLTVKMVVSINGGTQEWMVDFRENPKQKWMIVWGTPISRNLETSI